MACFHSVPFSAELLLIFVLFSSWCERQAVFILGIIRDSTESYVLLFTQQKTVLRLGRHSNNEMSNTRPIQMEFLDKQEQELCCSVTNLCEKKKEKLSKMKQRRHSTKSAMPALLTQEG